MQRCLHGHFILGPKGALEVTLGRCGDGTNARAEGTQLLAAATEAREEASRTLVRTLSALRTDSSSCAYSQPRHPCTHGTCTALLSSSLLVYVP